MFELVFVISTYIFVFSLGYILKAILEKEKQEDRCDNCWERRKKELEGYGG